MSPLPNTPESVGSKLAAAFGETSKPGLPVEEESAPYGYEWRFEYLAKTTWFEMANDANFLSSFIEDELYFMREEWFLYLFPGYLLGVIKHHLGIGGRDALIRILGSSPQQNWANALLEHLGTELNPSQKQAVAPWLQLHLIHDREWNSKLYESQLQTPIQAAFDQWQQYL